MVAVEAAASGLPVVGTRVGVLPDLGDGATDRARRGRGGLAGALAAVLDDPGRAARMAAAGRAVAVSRFDVERTSADLLDRYATLVSREAGAPGDREPMPRERDRQRHVPVGHEQPPAIRSPALPARADTGRLVGGRPVVSPHDASSGPSPPSAPAGPARCRSGRPGRPSRASAGIAAAASRSDG